MAEPTSDSTLRCGSDPRMCSWGWSFSNRARNPPACSGFSGCRVRPRQPPGRTVGAGRGYFPAVGVELVGADVDAKRSRTT